MPNQEKVKELLSDLGRATLRGVRKCPKCGTYNGTRGLSCKNKSCDVIFKEAGERKKLSIEACKIVTGSSQHVYSVRVRDKGPDYRSFVKLPPPRLVVSDDGSSDPEGRAMPKCYVESCQKYSPPPDDVSPCNQDPLGSWIIGPDPPRCPPTPNFHDSCQHIQAALRCFADAHPLTVKSTVLDTLDISGETKQAIWLLATESRGPLVQRVSKHIMVVKCRPTTSHPLGYLHFSFFTTRLHNSVQHKFYCGCRFFKQAPSKANGDDETGSHKRCVHFYACVCAFACDDKLATEFAHYIHLDRIVPRFSPTLSTPVARHLLAILKEQANNGDVVSVGEGVSAVEGGGGRVVAGDDGDLAGGEEGGVEVEVLMKDDHFLDASDITIGEDVQVQDLEHIQVHIHTVDGDSITFAPVPDDAESEILEVVGVKRRRDDTLQAALQEQLVTPVSIPPPPPPPPLPPPPKRAGKKPPAAPKKDEPVGDPDRAWTFEEWLSSVTERMNRSMHFELDGRATTISCLTPHRFFEQLRERISCGSKKRRLPNHTLAGQTCSSLPHVKGSRSYTKYVWHLTNIIHVKRVFDTGQVQLQVTRSFLQNRDGSYESYTPPAAAPATSAHTHIKPLELRTFLKVGNTSPGQKEPTPFIIEWIPDVLPESQIGELRLTFQFGHQRNGQLLAVHPLSTPAPIVPASISHQPPIAPACPDPVSMSSPISSALADDGSVHILLS